jgi:hypothetical protein
VDGCVGEVGEGVVGEVVVVDDGGGRREVVDGVDVVPLPEV